MLSDSVRISKALGKNWARDRLGTCIRVRLQPVIVVVRGNMLSGSRISLGTYLGIEVAIKEVLPSNEYDVSKYFEREWRLMK